MKMEIRQSAEPTAVNSPPNSSTYNLATTSTDHPRLIKPLKKPWVRAPKQESVRICDAFYQFFE